VRLHDQSHGESLLSLFTDRLGTSERCIYLLDETENALSPTRQMGFLRLLRDWESSGNAQMIVATHSPIIMSYPGATILSFDGKQIEQVEYEDTEHYRITKAFLGNPKIYHAQLFDDVS
jgi:predicted ATPase